MKCVAFRCFFVWVKEILILINLIQLVQKKIIMVVKNETARRNFKN